MSNDNVVTEEIDTTSHRPDPIKFEEFIERIKNEKSFPQNMSKCFYSK